jgi:hypothetical protein
LAEDTSTSAQHETDRIAKWDAEVCTNLMSTPQGRYFVERYLEYCCEGRDLYLNDGDALGMAMRDGLARAGRWLRVKLEEHCPDRYLQMVRERRGRIARAQAAITAKEEAETPAEPVVGAMHVEAMADEQARKAAEEAAAAARKAAEAKPKPKKG